MSQNPVTQKHLGILPDTWSDQTFADVRHKAHNDYVERKKKAKRNKQVKVPKFYPSDLVVSSNGSFRDTNYCLYEVIDFEETYNDFTYFGILLMTTDRKLLPRIGRIREVRSGWLRSDHIKKYEPKECKIKWLDPNNPDKKP